MDGGSLDYITRTIDVSPLASIRATLHSLSMAMTRNTEGRSKHDSRKGRESLSKRLGKIAKQIKARDAHTCVYCGQTEGQFHLDHIIPRSQGGADIATNLVVACARCNTARKDLSLKQWAVYAKVAYGLTVNVQIVRAQLRRSLPKAA